MRAMYKHMFYPGTGNTLAFIGFARPSSGGVPVAAEMQARYFALMCTGSRKLPNDWEKRLQHEADLENAQFHLTQLKTIIFYGDWMESMAQHIRCAPDLWTYIFTNPLFWFRLQYGAMIASQYRLQGPHMKPAIAKKVINSLPMKTPPMIIMAQSIVSVLSWIGGLVGFRPPSW